MSVPESVEQELRLALQEGDPSRAEAAAQAAVEAGVDPLGIVEGVLIPALTEIGDQFQNGAIFLPELMMAGKAAEGASGFLNKAIVSRGEASASKGKILLGTVQGDIHDIGKNIVTTILRAHGFEVVDLGRDVAPSAFLDAAQRHAPDVIGMSSLMTTTRPLTKNTINLFNELGLREKYCFIVGGGCVTEDWGREIGADGYAPDAASAAALCKRLLHVKG